MSRGKVLVLGGDTRSFLAVIRSLGRGKIEVHTAWCPSDSPALKSRYIKQHHRIPFPTRPREEWQPVFAELLQREQFSLVLPTNDQCLLPLYQEQDSFELLARLYLPDKRIFEITNDKIALTELAHRLGVQQPPYRVVENEADVERALLELEPPYVVKPRSSFSLEDLHSKRHVWKARDRETFRSRVSAAIRGGAVLVQEHFHGIGVGVEVLADSGRILMSFQHERLHEPLLGGASTYRKSTPVDPRLLHVTSLLCNELRLTGVAMFEYRLSFDRDRWIFVEINNRFWGSLPLPVAAGADFPLALYEYLVEGRREFSSSAKIPLYARNLVTDIRWMISNATADHGDPLLNTRPNLSVVLEWFNILRGREVWDTLAADDPRPFANEMLGYIRKVSRRIAARVRGFYRDFAPVHESTRARIRALLRPGSNILFVCKGNICRSPFAEHFARQYFGESYTFRSAGFLDANRAAPQQAIQIAKTFRVSLDDYRSQTVNRQIVDQAALIFVFDEQNLQSMITHFPSAAKKTFLLGSAAMIPLGEIADPFGGDAEDFERAYCAIETALTNSELKLSQAV